ncbi:hypothetical protein F5146DRAFT_1005485 [Armillaria mellea]|nr:hypothetical protein F5146DRAFT_1005485 [Armillaria mellea]
MVLLSCKLHAWVTSIICVTTLRTSTRACETSACKEKEGCIEHYFTEMMPESGTRFGCRHDVINGGWDGSGTRPSLSPTRAHNAKCDVKALLVTQECLQGRESSSSFQSPKPKLPVLIVYTIENCAIQQASPAILTNGLDTENCFKTTYQCLASEALITVACEYGLSPVNLHTLTMDLDTASYKGKVT